MKNVKLIFLLATVCNIIFSCKNKSIDPKKETFPFTKAYHTSVLDIDKVKPEIIPVSKVFSDIAFTKLETTTQSRLASVDEILFYKNLYLIFDIKQKSIICFDSEGKFKFKIFPAGKGPLEVNGISDYTINILNNTIDIYDFSLQKIVSYDLSGKAIREKKFKYLLREFACTGNGDYVVYAPDLFNSDNSVPGGAFIVDSLGNFKYSFLSTNINGMYGQPINCLSGFGDSITLTSNYSKDIFLINNDKISKILKINYRDKWEDNLLLSQSSGSWLNIVYRKELNSPKSYSSFFNIQTGKQYNFEYIINDLFSLPIAIPYFYKDGNTMIGILSAEGVKETLKNTLQNKNSYTNEKLFNEVTALMNNMLNSDNPLMIKLTLK